MSRGRDGFPHDLDAVQLVSWIVRAGTSLGKSSSIAMARAE